MEGEYPKVIIWDLDGTVWNPEMYQLYGGAPFQQTKDFNVADRRGEKVELLGDCRALLQHLKTLEVKVAIASTCDEPDWAYECMDKIGVEHAKDKLTEYFHADLIEIYKSYSKETHLKGMFRKELV
jgi:magnesium-dependent phosphatase 1